MTGKFKKFLLVNAVALAASSFNANAEQSLNQILTTIDSGSWAEITNLSNFYNSSWNVAGTTLNFKLSAEESSLASAQTFSVQNNLIFRAAFLFDPGSVVGDTGSFMLGSQLSSANSFSFSTNLFGAPNENVYSIWFNASSNTYVLAYEDSPNYIPFGSTTPVPRDYNDMVVSFKVTPAVTPVPEANTAAMLGLGLGMIGWTVRRRKHHR